MAGASKAEPVFGRSRRKAAEEGARWRLGAVLCAAVAVLLFALNALLGEIHSGNAWGLFYGSVALLLLLACAAFGLRRRTMHLSSRLGLGRSRVWLYLHLYGGGLFLLFLGMHTGFDLPMGPLAWWLWLLSLWTVGTGALGLVLQQWLPRVMTSSLRLEVHFDRIPVLVENLRERAETLVEGAGDDVRGLYRREVEPVLGAPRFRWRFFVDPTANIQARLADFEYLRGLLVDDELAQLEELEQIFRSKLEMDAHYTLQQPLRLWLYLHVPTSLLLLAAVGLHLFSVGYY